MAFELRVSLIQDLLDEHFLYFTNFISTIFLVTFSDAYRAASTAARQRIRNLVARNFKPDNNADHNVLNNCKKEDAYLNVCDDFKTNLLHLTLLVPTVEGVALKLPVNYRQVLQPNYFKRIGDAKCIHDAAYEPDGDTFQNSPLKLVFYVALDHQEPHTTNIKLTSISKVTIDATNAKLPKDTMEHLSKAEPYSNLTIENADTFCRWPSEDDFADYLYLLGFQPYGGFTNNKHDFPWNEVLSIFNDENMEDSLALKHMLVKIGWKFLYKDQCTFAQNLKHVKDFHEYISPIHCSATEGDHRLDLANRLLYGIKLEQKAPFLQTEEDFLPLPFNSTVFKPIAASVFLPCQDSSDLCMVVTSHLQQLSRKVAGQKKLFIQDHWCALYQSILNAVGEDKLFRSVLYSTQEEFYRDSVNPRQEPNHRARKIRLRLSEVITDVIFTENPTCTMAKEPLEINRQDWLDAMKSNNWTAMDNNPFTAVSTKFMFAILFVTKFMVTIILVILI